MKRLIILASAIILFTSCIGIESNFNFNHDGSGVLTFKYRISQMFLSMGQTGEEGESNAPLPISEEDLRSSVEGVEGLRLISVTQEETETDITITAVIEFRQVEALSQTDLFEGMPISFERSGTNFTFRQVVTEGEDEALDEESLEMMLTYFEGYEFEFQVKTPKRIINYTLGAVSADKQVFTYSISMIELLRITKFTEYSVTW